MIRDWHPARKINEGDELSGGNQTSATVGTAHQSDRQPSSSGISPRTREAPLQSSDLAAFLRTQNEAPWLRTWLARESVIRCDFGASLPWSAGINVIDTTVNAIMRRRSLFL